MNAEVEAAAETAEARPAAPPSESGLIVAEVAPLRVALAAASAAAPLRSPKPVLQSVLLSADGAGGCTVTGTDLEASATASVAGVVATDRGGPAAVSVLLTPARLKAVLDGPGDASVSFEVEGGKVTVRRGRNSFAFATDDPGLYPVPEAGDYSRSVEVAGDDLKSAVARVAYATDPDSQRYALGGALLEKDGEGDAEGIALVASDGRRLVRHRLAAAPTGGGIESRTPPVVPTRALNLIARNASGNVRIAVNGSFVHADCGAVRVSHRLLEGRFPRYQDVFVPEGEVTCRATATAGAWADAVRQASVAASEESRGVDVSFRAADGALPACAALSAASADVGRSDVYLEFDSFSGEPGALTLDGRYLGELARSFPPDEALEAAFAGEKKAMTFRTRGGDTVAVLMPLTRER